MRTNLALQPTALWQSRVHEALPLDFEITIDPDGDALMFIHHNSDPEEGDPILARHEGLYYLVFGDRVYCPKAIEEEMIFVRSAKIIVAELKPDMDLGRVYTVKTP